MVTYRDIEDLRCLAFPCDPVAAFALFSWRVHVLQADPPWPVSDAPSWPRSSLTMSGAFFCNIDKMAVKLVFQEPGQRDRRDPQLL